nr:ribonuclease H-like domain-containing protein [Tanacetum cinerariifolium]
MQRKKSRVEGLEYANTTQQLEILKLKARVKKLERLNKVKSSKLRRLKKVGTTQRIESSENEENVFNQGRKSVDIDEGIKLVDDQEKDAQVKERQADTQEEIYNIDLDHTSKVLSMQEDIEVQEVVEVVNAAKLITEVVTTATTQLVAPPVPLRSHSSSKGLKRPKKTCFVCKSETHFIKDCDFHARKLAQNSCAPRDIHKHNAPMKHSRIHLHKVYAATPTSKSVLSAAARTIGATRPTFSKTRPHIAPYTVSKSKAPIRRPFIRHTTPKPRLSPLRVNAANPSVVSAARFNTANPSAVSAARVKAARPFAVSAAHINAVKPSVGNPQQALKDKGVIDSGCSRHMTGNISYLSDFEELNGGYVTFGGNPKGGKITGKGKIKTGKLDFDDVYYVKELKFNLFSVSQMCDRKNNVLFTDTECLVLSSDFKLPDDSQVMLRVPRENN